MAWWVIILIMFGGLVLFTIGGILLLIKITNSIDKNWKINKKVKELWKELWV